MGQLAIRCPSLKKLGQEVNHSTTATPIWPLQAQKREGYGLVLPTDPMMLCSGGGREECEEFVSCSESGQDSESHSGPGLGPGPDPKPLLSSTIETREGFIYTMV